MGVTLYRNGLKITYAGYLAAYWAIEEHELTTYIGLGERGVPGCKIVFLRI